MKTPEFLYLVRDHGTKCILLSSKFVNVAHAVTLGLVNTEVVATSAESPKRQPILAKDFFRTQNMTLQDYEFGILDPKLDTDELRQRRILAIERARFLSKMFRWVEKSSSRAYRYFEPSVFNLIQNELNSCQPALHQFTQKVQDYAFINSISEENAYSELKLFVDSVNGILFRNFALSQKYIRLINRCVEIKDFKRAYDLLRRETLQGVQG